MKPVLIFILILLIFLVYKKFTEKYMNEPYITVHTAAGLNNRIQVLLSYLYKANKEYKKLKIVWIPNDQCPDRFDNLFENIDNVEIIYDTYTENIDYKNEWDKENTDYIDANYYSLLKPVESIQKEIDNTKLILGNIYIACHIRRTDALTHHGYKHHITSDDDYIEFIDQYPKELKIYISTDCRDTQQKFIDIYGDRMVYKKIEKTNELRQTSLQDAVKDMYVCAGATYFMRSFGSFSDTIEYLREL